MSRVGAVVAVALVAGCREEARPAPVVAMALPFSTVESIPDAPVNGVVHGAPFVLRDARYVIDRRPGYAHTDVVLSSGTAETACAPVTPPQSASVWLRLDGPGAIATTSTRTGPGTDGRWQVHYQAFVEDRWVGAGDGSALLSLHEPGPDGRLSGGIAACFADGSKSCVSGSFEAVACPPSIDQPVRGSPPPEKIPSQYLQRVRD